VPIYAYVDGLCASGGMYIASAAEKIYASPSSTVGSVGIILGPAFNFSQTMDKIGVQSLTLTEGKDKDMLNPFRPWKEGEYDSLKTVLSSLYDRFVDVVVTGRPRIDKERLVNEYGAQVYVGNLAEEYGYIDAANSNYPTALKDLAKEANIPEGQSYQVVKMEIPHPFLSQFADGKSPLLTGKISHHFQIGSNLSSEMSGKFLYLYQPSGT
jgi:ClpP class serine protease